MIIALSVLALIIILSIGAVYIHDKRQNEHTILRNFPVIGHVRYFAETWGEYMRQYQYLPDWAERPFNRLERSWVYPLGQGHFQSGQFRQREPAEFRFPKCCLSGPGGRKTPLARQVDRHRERSRRPVPSRSRRRISLISVV